MRQFIFHIISAALLGALIGAIAVFTLAEMLPEGAIMGGILGGSIGLLIAVRRHYGASGPAYEYEAAGIHDDNLVTTARRNLVREAYRDSVTPPIIEEKIKRLGSANRSKPRC